MGQNITIQCKLGWFDMNLGIDKTIYQTHRVVSGTSFLQRKIKNVMEYLRIYQFF